MDEELIELLETHLDPWLPGNAGSNLRYELCDMIGDLLFEVAARRRNAGSNDRTVIVDAIHAQMDKTRVGEV